MTTDQVLSSVLAGNYVENSTIQREVINDALLNVRRGVDISPSVSPCIIVDFGSDYGQNLIHVIKFIIRCLKQSQKVNDEKDVLIVHNDLLTNNWSSLFESLKIDQSFYEQCLPKNSLTIGYSSNSIH